MPSIALSNRKIPKDGLDFYPTPPWATRTLFEYGYKDIISKDDTIWEPACGHFHMSNIIKEYFTDVVTSDIMYGQDFLNDEHLVCKPDWIITNPPFNVGKDFALKSLETAKRGVAFLVRFSFLESIKRWEELYSIHKPAKVLIFTRRVGFLPSEVSRNTNSAVPYIWLVWDNKHKGPTEFDWIGHDRDKLEKFGDYPEDNMIFEDHLQ